MFSTVSLLRSSQMFKGLEGVELTENSSLPPNKNIGTKGEKMSTNPVELESADKELVDGLIDSLNVEGDDTKSSIKDFLTKSTKHLKKSIAYLKKHNQALKVLAKDPNKAEKVMAYIDKKFASDPESAKTAKANAATLILIALYGLTNNSTILNVGVPVLMLVTLARYHYGLKRFTKDHDIAEAVDESQKTIKYIA
jgi:hypothetical protein